jgi:hypothetical protein
MTVSRRHVLATGAALGAAMMFPRIVRAASIPYEYACDKSSGFVPNPNEHKRVGYLTDFSGLGLTTALSRDLTVYTPYNAAKTYAQAVVTKQSNQLSKMNVVGVIDKFEWDGGVGGSLKISAWMSQQNAFLIKSAQQLALKTTAVKSLGYWIIDYDQETKVWYEKSFPKTPTLLTGIIGPKDNPDLNVDLNGAPAKDGINVMVYRVSFSLAPAANQAYSLYFANSSTKSAVKNWGLVVGTLGAGAVK